MNPYYCSHAYMHPTVLNIHYVTRHSVQYEIIMIRFVLAEHPS